MPIYEYQCTKCKRMFERLEMSVKDIPTSQCPFCHGVGTKCISAPAIVYELFDPTAVHKLPDWNQKMARAEAHDAAVRRKNPALANDLGQGIKVHDIPFGHNERKKLAQKAQLDNMP